MGRHNSKPSIGSHGHSGGRRPGQTPKDLSGSEREERGIGEGVGLYNVYMCEREGGGQGKCGLKITISPVIHTWIHQSRGLRQTMTGWTTITDVPVYMCERGGWGRGECGLKITISPVIHT